MLRTMLQAKLHRFKVTQTELDYEGSVGIDATLMEASGIKEFQQIHIYNVNNGERFTSYAVAAEANSGTIAVLGAAARRVSKADVLIIAAYSEYDDKELVDYAPSLVFAGDDNTISHSHNAANI